MKNETTLGLSTVEKIITIIILPIIGAVCGWFIPTISEWIVKLPFFPLGGLFEWIASLESRWVSIIAAIVGMIAGLIFVFYIFREALEITITDNDVKLYVKEKEYVIHKNEILAIYMEGKELVFLGIEGKELFRGHPDLKHKRISEAFTHRWYPWKDNVPYLK